MAIQKKSLTNAKSAPKSNKKQATKTDLQVNPTKMATAIKVGRVPY